MGNCRSKALVDNEATFPNMTPEEIKRLEFDWNAEGKIQAHLQQAQGNKVRLFLLVKGITEDVAEHMFREANNDIALCRGNYQKQELFKKPDNMTYVDWWLTSNHDHAQRMQNTLLELLNPLFVSSSLPVDVESFDEFVAKYPQWAKNSDFEQSAVLKGSIHDDDVLESNDSSDGDVPDGPFEEQKSDTTCKCFVFFRDHKKVKGKNGVLIQRTQRYGNSYIHSPIIAHHYAMSLNVQDPVTIDINAFILRNLEVELLAKLIFHVAGTSSKHVFLDILGDYHLDCAIDFGRIRYLLEKYGAGLVSYFNIETKFVEEKSAILRGKYHTPIIGSHSMVLVGIREDSDKKKYLLFQNSWKERQWIECDYTYFAHSHANIYFTTSEVRGAPTHFLVTKQFYAETNVAGNDLPPEECRI